MQDYFLQIVEKYLKVRNTNDVLLAKQIAVITCIILKEPLDALTLLVQLI